jgi:hypothetical protein
MSPEEFMKRLEAVATENGKPFPRVHLIFDEDQEHSKQFLNYKGYLTLSDAFKNFFLETVECLNRECRPRVSEALSSFYPMLIERQAQHFRSLCAAERVAVFGYPLHGYTLLRNAFDSLVLTSAVAQGITDFHKHQGIDPSKPLDPLTFRKLRRKEEQAVRLKMTGKESGLSQQTLQEISLWDTLFDDETHGGSLSLAQSVGWLRGAEPLPVLPTFSELSAALFINRFCEMAWMTHRIMPLTQPSGIPFPTSWKQKWRVLDECFQEIVESLTKKLKKDIGTAIVELVHSKFPFNEISFFWA